MLRSDQVTGVLVVPHLSCFFWQCKHTFTLQGSITLITLILSIVHLARRQPVPPSGPEDFKLTTPPSYQCPYFQPFSFIFAPPPFMVRWCRWSCQCCCSDAQLTCALASSWSPLAAHSPCRTPSPPALLAPPRGGARSWASATQTWTTSRRMQSSTWVHMQTHISSDFSKNCYKHRFFDFLFHCCFAVRQLWRTTSQSGE